MRPNPHPLRDYVVRVVGAPAYWRASPTLDRFRRLGGSVVTSLAPSITHLVTIQDPATLRWPMPGGFVSRADFDDYAKARAYVERLSAPVAVIGAEAFKDWLASVEREAERVRRVDQRARIFAGLSFEAPSGLVAF